MSDCDSQSDGPNRPPARPAALAAGLRRACLREASGAVAEIDLAAAARRARAGPPLLVCHAKALAERLGCDPFPALDLLELFAFVRPARFCLPTARGLARALNLPLPAGPAAEAALLPAAADALLAELAALADADRDRAAAIAKVMGRGGWPWTAPVLGALGADPDSPPPIDALAVWERLAPWEDRAPEPPPGNDPITDRETRARLAALLDSDAEARPQQADYASAAAAAFQPRDRADTPRLVLAEAGTGTGKTLGYIAPASLWAEKNAGPVWISTFTRNLQHQIDAELDRLYPDPAAKRRHVVLRKGRENYLCLLNLEEAGRGLAARTGTATALGLMTRWAEATRDGDMTGGDFPAWLADILGRGRTLGLADRRGECIYSACPHYRRCFIEKTVRRARRADIVIANHALVMVQAALHGLDDSFLPTRYVFDEGHHLFAAADAAFSGHLTGVEMADLRRWVRGAEGRGRSRARGLARRVEELTAGDDAAAELVADAAKAAAELPGEGWAARLADGAPRGAGEAFLALLRQQVLARASAGGGAAFGADTDCRPPVPGLIEAAAALAATLGRLADPMTGLAARLRAKLDKDAADLPTETRAKIEAVCRGLARRAEVQLAGWRGMLDSLAAETPAAFVDWFAVERFDGRERDMGMHRHWLDPTLPFAETVAGAAQGVLVTSATLRDGSGDAEADWRVAEQRTGALHLARPASEEEAETEDGTETEDGPARGAVLRAAVPSPFDYAARTRILIVTDVARDDPAQVAAAYRELFLAAGGGALGLFTAIARLRAVHARLAPALEAAGLPLWAQHVDRLDTNSLIEIFRAEEESCLLGTDAVRDGVDVPGRALRLIVFDRVPWPRPDILHKARRAAFGAGAHDDMLTRLRLKQAFGRLVRRADDRGVFVLLDSRMPSRLLGAFPEGAAVDRVGLADAVAATRAFLSGNGAKPLDAREAATL